MKTNNYATYLFVLMGVLIIFASSCSKDIQSKPELTTIDASGFTYHSAICGGSITSDGDAEITERGICWSNQQNPAITDHKLADTATGPGDFTINITSLPSNVSIYGRAYATNSQGTSYGNEISFTLWLNAPGDPVTDIDNESYSSVKIGNQVWITTNLKVTHYRNGDPISNIPLQDDSEWLNTTSGAYCTYEDNSANAERYGYLYNGYAVLDSRNICPVGWHIPTQNEWEILVNYLGGNIDAGNMLKSKMYWENLNVNTTNMSGFSALPGGFRLHPTPERTYTMYTDLKLRSFFWSKDENKDYPFDAMWYIQMMNTTEWAMIQSNTDKKCGLSVRCIKD